MFFIVYLIFRMHLLNQPHLVDIDSSGFLQNFQVYDGAPIPWVKRNFNDTDRTIQLISKCRIKYTTLVMGVVWDS